MERYFEISSLKEADDNEMVTAVYPEKTRSGWKNSETILQAEKDAKENKCTLLVWRETDLDTVCILTKPDLEQIEIRYENALRFEELERAEALAGILRMVGRAPLADNMNLPVSDKEDKQQILNSLTRTLKLTRAGADVTRIDYEKDSVGEERAYIAFNNTYKKFVNITGDSGKSMIEEVTRALS